MLFKTSFLLFIFTFAIPHLSGNEKPNVLFISVDDWNDWLGCFDNKQAITPNLDKLANRGVACVNAHTSAVYCAPSRTSLMTGKEPFNSGCYADEPHFAETNLPNLIDLPGWFKKHDYKVNGGGKLYHHMPGFIDMRSWDDYFIWNDVLKKNGWGLNAWDAGAPLPSELPASPVAKELTPKASTTKYGAPKVNSHMEWGALKNSDENKMADTICTDWAVNFLKQKHDKPFFLGYGLYAPHKPNFVPQKYFDLYPLDKIQLPNIKENDLDDLPPLAKKKALNLVKHVHEKVVRLNVWKEAIQGYLASLTYADTMIGRVLDQLEKSPYYENTIVVLWSDNGYHLGEKGKWAKHSLWERTSNVPMIWAGPGIAKGITSYTTSSLLDIYPTLNALCGLPQNSENDGFDMSKDLAHPENAKDRIVLQTNHKSHSVINQEWRYIKYENGEEELYHVKNDPNEWTNLAEKPEMKNIKMKLAKSLPQTYAPIGKGPKTRTLRLSANENGFQWLVNKNPSKTKGKKKKKK